MLNSLLVDINKQIEEASASNIVEILIDKDNRESTIGAKRNRLVNGSTGKYICFIDDDDLISENYIKLVINAISSNCDCVGIRGIIRSIVNEYNGKIFEHSIDCAGWYTGANGVFYRTPNHLNPIKLDIVKKVFFNSAKNGGEDQDFSNRVKQHIKTEQFIDEPIYIYRMYQAGERTW